MSVFVEKGRLRPSPMLSDAAYASWKRTARRPRQGDFRRSRPQGGSCVAPNILKHMNNFGAWNFLYSGTENREFSTPRTPFSQIPPQAAPRVPAPRPGSPRVLRAASKQIPFLFRIRPPARPLRSCRRAAGAIRGDRADGSRQKTAQRKRLLKAVGRSNQAVQCAMENLGRDLGPALNDCPRRGAIPWRHSADRFGARCTMPA